jgi:RDD family
MGVVVWEDGRVAIRDAVALDKPVTGARLRDAFIDAMPTLTLGLVRMRGNALKLGSLELLRFGAPTVTRNAVDWPIEGGLLARRAGGRWRLQATAHRVDASVTGYAPSLPRALYAVSQMQVHLLFTHLLLLRLRGRKAVPGEPATSADRVAAATVDAALCFSLPGFAGRRRLRSYLAVAAIYHIVCWSVSGRTLGGAVMRQRVVAVDGSRLTPQQAVLRLALLPLSWIAWRPLHDRIAQSAVIKD